MRRKLFVLAVFLMGASAAPALAQDAAKVDSKHYKVELENGAGPGACVSYAPAENSVMHSHLASVVVFLTGAMPDRKAHDSTIKAARLNGTPRPSFCPRMWAIRLSKSSWWR